jgi:dsRNA-specific ribonuclease
MRELLLSNENVDKWLKAYHLRQRFAIEPRLRESMDQPDVSELPSPSDCVDYAHNPVQESRQLFNAYTGAVFTHNGVMAARDWIGNLIVPLLGSGQEDNAEMEQWRLKD